MKRFISIILTLLIIIMSLVACNQGNNQESNNSGDKISIITTIFAPYDFVREVAGGKVDITMLIPPASESHSYEPTPQDMIKIQNCDIFIYVGGDSDTWVKGMLSSIDTSSMKIVTLMDCVNLLEEEIVEGMEEDGDREEAEYDQHVWTSPKNAKLIITRISDVLCEIDANNIHVYKENTNAYLEKLDELNDAFKAVMDNAVRKTIIFGDRFPFRYLVDAYGLEYFAAFPGCSTETEPNARTIAFLIDKIKEEKIPVVFHPELSNKKMANTISEATGAKILLLHACHNITKDDFQNGVSYLDLMAQNVTALKEALQ